jgi:hypothetical protein
VSAIKVIGQAKVRETSNVVMRFMGFCFDANFTIKPQIEVEK